MEKNLPTVRKEKSLQELLARTKKIVDIGNRIINNPTKPLAVERDITEILKWSDEFDLGLPRTLEELKELKEIEFDGYNKKNRNHSAPKHSNGIKIAFKRIL